MKYVKRILYMLWENTALSFYKDLVEIVYKIKTGEDKFYWEIQEDKKKDK